MTRNGQFNFDMVIPVSMVTWTSKTPSFHAVVAYPDVATFKKWVGVGVGVGGVGSGVTEFTL